MARRGYKHLDAKPLRGFGGAGTLEILETQKGNTYRAVYTVKFISGVYVLHCFQKKSKRGSKTPKKEMDLIKNRLEWARQEHLKTIR